MQTIEDRLKEIFSTTNFNSSELEEFEKSSREFEEMVSKGVVKRRGYTLLTVEGASYPSMAFNTANI